MEVRQLIRDAQQGRLQRSLALTAGLTGGLSGIEVAYMHYRGSYSRRVMWTPVIMTQVLLAAGVAAALRPRLARNLLPVVSAVTLADCAAGFYFHIRGTARKPGGWRLLVPNVAMGPPPMAPLLLGISAYLGVLASRLEPEGGGHGIKPELRLTLSRHLDIVTALAALASGVEALYSHQKNNFRYGVQYTPLVVAPAVAATAFAAAAGSFRARQLLPVVSALAIVDGAVGFGYHARGILRRPGGARHLVYNILYGPPVMAPLLFAACGLFGLLATALGKRT